MGVRPTRVVFDIGAVLIEWDPRHLYRRRMDEAAAEDFLSRILPPEWNRAQDEGRDWRLAEAEGIARFPGHAADIRSFRACWHDMVPCQIDGSIRILDRLRSIGTPLYAITNFASDTFRETQIRFPFLKESFIDVVISGDERLLKPDPAIFKVLLDRQRLTAEDCVFIDDSRANVDAAAELDFYALHFTTPEKCAEDLRRLGFPV
ncbi:MAG: HAD family hydrolase [Beijerinckiaceae bacterium]